MWMRLRWQHLGAAVKALSCFPAGVNVSFVQVVGRNHVRLRVYERGAGETLACGTGACAAVVCGIHLKGCWIQRCGSMPVAAWLHIGWSGDNAPVILTGPAVTVYRGEIELPNPLPALPRNLSESPP